MVGETARQLGPPDILVNNAGVYPRVPLLQMRESDWDYVLDINLKAGCFATIAVAKALIAAGKPGSVVNLASSAIRGAVRADFYWGSGAEAGTQAGRMRQRGRLWILWPKGESPPR